MKSSRKNIPTVILVVAFAFAVGSLLGLQLGFFVSTTIGAKNKAESSFLDSLLGRAAPQEGNDVAVTNRRLLHEQVRVQNDFQKMVYELMHPPDCQEARILRKIENKRAGFASEFHEFSRSLQVAIATGRALVVTDEWQSSFAPPDCRWPDTASNTEEEEENGTAATASAGGGFTCLWKAISNCTGDNVGSSNRKTKKTETTSLDSSLSVGIVSGNSGFFDTEFYGNQRVVDAPTWPFHRAMLIDVLPHFERLYGRFWVRAQVVHYLWKPSDGLEHEIQTGMPLAIMEKKDGSSPSYIAFHVRFTDNVGDLKEFFGRDATITRDFGRFMSFANMIRTNYDNSLQYIYLATDNPDIIQESKRKKWSSQKEGWKFVYQKDDKVVRTRSTGLEWFWDKRSKVAAGLATDLEMMRRADFLVGSFQSNVYRLAAELNTAWFADKYPFSMKRHFTVDVEWYEDP